MRYSFRCAAVLFIDGHCLYTDGVPNKDIMSKCEDRGDRFGCLQYSVFVCAVLCSFVLSGVTGKSPRSKSCRSQLAYRRSRTSYGTGKSSYSPTILAPKVQPKRGAPRRETPASWFMISGCMHCTTTCICRWSESRPTTTLPTHLRAAPMNS